MTELHRSLVANLKALRRHWGYSQADLAERAGVSAGYVGEIEVGTKWPSADKVEALAKALHVKPFQLFLDEADTLAFQAYLEKRDQVQEFGEQILAYFEKRLK